MRRRLAEDAARKVLPTVTPLAPSIQYIGQDEGNISLVKGMREALARMDLRRRPPVSKLEALVNGRIELIRTGEIEVKPIPARPNSPRRSAPSPRRADTVSSSTLPLTELSTCLSNLVYLMRSARLLTYSIEILGLPSLAFSTLASTADARSPLLRRIVAIRMASVFLSPETITAVVFIQHKVRLPCLPHHIGMLTTPYRYAYHSKMRLRARNHAAGVIAGLLRTVKVSPGTVLLNINRRVQRGIAFIHSFMACSAGE